MEQYDRPDVMEEIVMPFLLPMRRKSLSIHTIDNLVLGRLVDTDKGEKKEELKADLDFLYDDEILHNSIEKNFGLLFLELLDRLTRWEKLTLSEYNAILEIRFGKEIYENREDFKNMFDKANDWESLVKLSKKALTNNARLLMNELYKSGQEIKNNNGPVVQGNTAPVVNKEPEKVLGS
jgi:hypothetical protein